MAVYRIKNGLDVPLAGDPRQEVAAGPAIREVALMGDDTPGLRARLKVAEGDVVKRGQLLFEDRVRPGVRYTAPGAGRVRAIFRGARRALRSVVIELNESERSGSVSDADCQSFDAFKGGDPLAWSGADVRALMVESGLWTAFRTRPFSKVPLPEDEPNAILVTATDTAPHAPDPGLAFDAYTDAFQRGLRLVEKLCPGRTHLCIGPDSPIRGGTGSPAEVEIFEGPHPAGTAGVHIHFVAPASRARVAWHIGYADVIALGSLAATGRLPVERFVSVAGPPAKDPRVVRTRLGASLADLTAGEFEENGAALRILSGSALSGKNASDPEFAFLGRYHLQVGALREGGRKFLGWVEPGPEKFSLLPVFLGNAIPGKKFDFDTDTNGSPRPIFPLGTYEQVMPMDILATYLLRALSVGDIEEAEQLGALELDEEDLALCTYVCPGKNEFGPLLRANLDRIEKEG